MAPRTALLLACAILLLGAARAQEGPDEIQPAPASIGSDVPLTYFGPAPSSVDPRLVGPVQLLKSGTIDASTSPATITLPVYYGYTLKTAAGKVTKVPYFYVLTDTSDAANAAALGVNPSAKLKYAVQPGAYRSGRLDSRGFLATTSGWVDFSPVHMLEGGDAPDYFPPKSFQAGSVGVDGYSPLVVLGGEVYNVPIIADGRAPKALLSSLCGKAYSAAKPASANATAAKWVHDKVVSLCLNAEGTGGTVTLQLTTGFSFSKPVLYVSLDAFPDLPAALEAVTLSPGLGQVSVGNDDSLFSSVERLFAFTNGHTNGDIPAGPRPGGTKETVHPLRQGFNSAIRGDGFPLNVLGGIPTVATDYSPLWDVNLGSWTDYAIKAGYRTRVIDEFTYLGNVQRGYITGPGGGPFSSSGAIVNCPIVQRFL